MRVRKAFAVLAMTSLISVAMPWLGSSLAADDGTQVANYLVRLKAKADLTGIAKISDLNQRRWALFARLKQTSDSTQGALRDLLHHEQTVGRVVTVTPMWIDNMIAFRGQAAVANTIASRSEVESVSLDETVTIKQTAGSGTALWNLLKVRASGAGGVWDQGFSGAGVTVANIDTGVDFNHPGLTRQFRGDPAPGDARFHNNWFDFVGLSRYPIDPNGHGTHVMGVMVGGDGPGPLTPDTGLAYNSRWIAARAFDANGQGLTSGVVLASQWMLAPTDLNGTNPRPDLAPDVVNNSWGAGNGDGLCRPWYRAVIRNWRLANIMPVYSIGGSDGAHSPGDMGRSSIAQLEQSSSYATGASDSNDVKASFSPELKTGTGCMDQVPDQIRPNVLAPGVNIYSARPQGATTDDPLYTTKSGTSMAAAHVSGAAALMIEAAGGRGSITTNDYRLDSDIDASAPNVATGCTLQCRRLDALAAVQRVRKDGILTGRVTYVEAGIEKPLANAKVSAIPSSASGIARVTRTDAAGFYTLRKLDGTYDVEVRGPVTVAATGEVIGWIRQRLSGANAVTITQQDTITRNFLMSRAPNRPLEGSVLRYASGDTVAGVTLSLDETPLTAVTGTDGRFVFPQVPDPSIPDPASGDPTTDYDLLSDGDRCAESGRRTIVMKDSGGNNVQVVRPLRRDLFGYHCVEKQIDWVAGTSALPIRGDDTYASVGLPFEFPFYGSTRNAAYISTNGFVRFDRPSSEFDNTALPDKVQPNAAVYPFWDDLAMDDKSKILTTSTPDTFVIEFRRMTFAPRYSDRITFSVTLHRSGDIEFQYLLADAQLSSQGASATIGIENNNGEVGFQYSKGETVVSSGKSILFSSWAQVGEVRGLVRGNSGQIVSFATVKAVDASGASRTVHADANGAYRLWLKAGTYSINASAFHYDPATRTGVVVTDGNLPSCFPSSACPIDFTLTRQPGYTVSGVVADADTAARISGIRVTLANPNVPDVRTDGNGVYTFLDIPAGQYQLGVAGTNRCVFTTNKAISVSADTVENISTKVKRDSFGYVCRDDDPLDASHESGVLQAVVLNGDDNFAEVALPFTFPLYGYPTTKAFVSTNGFVRFDKGSSQYDNAVIPTAGEPNFAMFPFWDDLNMDNSSRVQTHTDGASFFSIEFKDVIPLSAPSSRMSFEVILHPDGKFEYQYQVADAETPATGTGATIGMEDRGGLRGFSYSVNEEAVESGRRIRYFIDSTTPATGVFGSVKATGTAAPIVAARVTNCGGCASGTSFTDAFGGYSLSLAPGTYSLTASKFGYTPLTKSVTVPASGFVTLNFDLSPAGTNEIFGVITDQYGDTIPGIEITIREIAAARPSSIFAGIGGEYKVALPAATYEVGLPGPCVLASEPAVPRQVILNGTPVNASFQATLLDDAFGYTCINRPTSYFAGLVPLALPGPGTTVFPGAAGLPPIYSPRIEDIGDDTLIPVPMNIEFPIYGKKYRIAYVSTDGYIQFDSGLTGGTGPVLNVLRVPAFVVDGAEIFVGPAGSDGWVIEWRGVRLGDTNIRVSFEARIRTNGDIDYFYKANTQHAAGLAKIGMEDGCAGASLVYADRVAGSVEAEDAIALRFPKAQKPAYVLCP